MRMIPDIVKELREEERLNELNNKTVTKLESEEKPDNSVDDETLNLSREKIEREESDIDFEEIKERYQTIFENYAVAITIADEKEQIVSWNKYAEELFNMTDKDLYLKHVSILYPPKEWKKIRKEDVRQKGMKYKLETKMNKKEGDPFDVEVSLSVLRGSEGKIVGSVGIVTDITRLKKTERTLTEFESRYKTVFENSAVGIMLTNENEEIVSWNKYAEKLLNMGEDDLYLKPVSSLYSSVEWKKIRSERVRDKGMQHHLETRVLRKKLDPLDVDISLSVLKNVDGLVVGSIGIVKDISERKRIENKMEAEQELLESLLDNVPDSVYFKDKNSRFIKVNKAKAEHSNITPDKMLGKTDFDFLPENEAKDIHQDDTDIMLTGEPIINKIEKLSDKKGNSRWVSVTKIPRYNKKGEIIGTMGISRDITDFKKAEEKSDFLSKTAMELNQFPIEEDVYGYIGEKIHELASNAFICISLFNEKTNKFEINRTYGFDKKIENIGEIENEEDLVGFNLEFNDEEWKKNILNGDLVKVSKEEFKKLHSHQSKEVCQAIRNLMNTDEICTMGLVKDGKVFGNVSIVAYKDHVIESLDTIQTFVNQAAVAVQRNSAMRQLTDLNKNLEKKVRERTVEVEKLLKQKDEFIGQLGHDLKNPMVPLTTLLPIVKERQNDPKSQELLEAVLKNVDYMKNLVVDTLELTQLNSPSTKLDIENVNLSDEINRVIVNNKVILEKKKVKIDNAVKNDLIVKADKLRILELFDNLIDNAVKYSSEGDKINIDAEQDEDTVTVTVSDVGIGISEEQMNHIFDEFYKGDESRSNFESCGLGLPICKRIVEKHGGRIWVESPGKDKGAKFHFTLKKASKK